MSNWQSCLTSIVTDIQGLSLVGIQSDEIKVRKRPRDKTRWYDGITVHPSDIRHGRGTNERDDIGYGCQVTMVERSGGLDTIDDVDKLILWDTAIRQKFINQLLSGVATVWAVTIEEATKFNDRASLEDYDVLALVVRPWIREARG